MTRDSRSNDSFYVDIVRNKKLWTIKDREGFPAPISTEGKRSTPFWSDVVLVERVIKNVPAYKNFTPHEIPLDEFLAKWIPGLENDAILIGVNWGGERAAGYDVEPKVVKQYLEGLMKGKE